MTNNRTMVFYNKRCRRSRDLMSDLIEHIMDTERWYLLRSVTAVPNSKITAPFICENGVVYEGRNALRRWRMKSFGKIVKKKIKHDIAAAIILSSMS